jgi:acetylornithine/succinyldiaminopimelate/putrescine aminotransferase
LLSCERGFHGKTLGSLSVTGNPHYQRPFEPLVPQCETIPFGDVESLQRALAATYVMTLLLREHGIYTQVARSNPRVLRVEPPLILTAEEASQFLQAVEQCCEEVDSVHSTTPELRNPAPASSPPSPRGGGQVFPAPSTDKFGPSCAHRAGASLITEAAYTMSRRNA